MQMLACYPARCPGNPDWISCSYLFSIFDQDMGKMAVNALKFSMLDPNIVAQDGVKAYRFHSTIHNVQHGIAICGKINPSVKIGFSGDRVYAHTKRGSDTEYLERKIHGSRILGTHFSRKENQ